MFSNDCFCLNDIFFFLNRWETKTLSMGIKALNTRIEELCFPPFYTVI